MEVGTLLAELLKLRVKVRCDRGRLIVDAPENALTVDLQARLKTHKAAILEYLTEGEGTSQPPIPSAEHRTLYPMSLQQQSMYALQQLDPGATAYNLPYYIEIAGELDVSRLHAAWLALIQRHESLRTSFEVSGNEFHQRVWDRVPFTMELLVGMEEEIIAWKNDFVRPFDLSRAPLLRVTLLRHRDAARYLLMIDMHHAVNDGVSMAVLINDLLKAYEGRQDPRPSLHYKDYAVWQREGAGRDVLQKQREYWMSQLSGEISRLNLPADSYRPALKSFAGRSVSFRLDQSLVAAVKDLCAARKVTLYMFFLAAFKVLLSKYSGQETVLIGAPVAARQHPDVARMSGLFVNTLALQSHPKGKKSFVQYLEEVKRTCLEAFENQSLPFVELVRTLQVASSAGRNPLFDVTFILQNMESADMKISGLELRPVEFEVEASQFDLSMLVNEVGDGIEYTLNYCTALFHPERIARLGRHYRLLLEELLRQPEASIAQLNFREPLPAGSVWPLAALAWEHQMESETTPAALFERRVLQSAEQVALVAGNRRLTYRQLNEAANRFARWLSSQGGDSSGPVAILVEPQVEMVVAILATLKLGRAFVLLNKLASAEDRRRVLIQSGAGLVLTPTASRAEEVAPIKCLPWEGDPGREFAEENLFRALAVDAPAYFPPSAASPEAEAPAVISHRELTAHWVAVAKRLQMQSGDRVWGTFCHFVDGSSMNFGAWIAAGAALLFSEESDDAWGGISLERAVSVEGATHISLTPMLFSRFARSPRNQTALSQGRLKHMALAGRDRGGKDPLNLFLAGNAPLEATVEEFFLRPDGRGYGGIYERPKDLARRPVLKPWGDGALTVLDPHGELQPIGVPGAIGMSAASPHETAILSGLGGEYREDGQIVCSGSVKRRLYLQGELIQPEDVERALLEFFSVLACVVVPLEKEDGLKLGAWLMVDDSFDQAALKEHLRNRLPGYLHPSLLRVVKELPLDTTGNIDVSLLPAAEDDAPLQDLEAWSSCQARLISAFEEILGRDRVGLNDDFFDLGGQSLKAIMLILKIEAEFGVKITIRDLFDAPNVASLSRKIELLEWVAANERLDFTSDEGRSVLTL